MRWSRADFGAARRAARQRWGVPDPLRTEALYQAAKTLADHDATHRDKLAASKLLLEADRHDLAEDKFAHAVGETGIPAVKDALTEAEERADALKPARPPDAGGSTPGAAGPVP